MKYIFANSNSKLSKLIFLKAFHPFTFSCLHMFISTAVPVFYDY